MLLIIAQTTAPDQIKIMQDGMVALKYQQSANQYFVHCAKQHYKQERQNENH